MSTEPNLFCRHCNFPLTELGAPAADAIVACPRCGVEESYASLAKEEAAVSRPAMVNQLRGLLRNRK
jgi:phage FluMu protein Com